jgi:hypothetical protein
MGKVVLGARRRGVAAGRQALRVSAAIFTDLMMFW